MAEWKDRPAQRPTLCGFKFTNSHKDGNSATIHDLLKLCQEIVDRGHGDTQVFLHEDHGEYPIRQIRLIEVNGEFKDDDLGVFPEALSSVFLLSSYMTEKDSR